MIRTCKHCGKPFEKTGFLRDFCSISCKVKYRREKQAQYKRRHRDKLKGGPMLGQKGSTISLTESRVPEGEKLESDGSSYPNRVVQGVQKGSTISPTKSRVSRGKKSGSQTLKTPYHEWAEKECCNYQEAKKTGFCISLTEPYTTWPAHTCDTCKIALSALEKKEKKAKKLNCKYNDCNAPLCPLYPENLEHCYWYPGEEICKLDKLQKEKWIQNQKEIMRIYRLKPTNDPVFDLGFYTYEMLNKMDVVPEGIKGIDPDKDTEPQMRKWFEMVERVNRKN